METKKNSCESPVAVLGSTGSVGTQALDVIEALGMSLGLMTAHRNVILAEQQVRRFSPAVAVMTDEMAAKDLAVRVADTKTRVLGPSSLSEEIARPELGTVIHSILGEAGLSPLLCAVECGKRIGLANKESLVIAGDHIMRRARETGAQIIPVDSEHSAIFQCIGDTPTAEIRSILLTASGGPFFGYTKDMLSRVTKAQTLAHPTWKMGAKITVDSATLMNKGFEVIEAVRLFGVLPEQIRVVVHRESIIHSAVEYIDSAVLAQMGVPDMRLCVQYALTYPARVEGPVARLSLFEVGSMSFYEPDTEAFPLLSEAFRAIRLGGGVPAALNAANEVAVEAFLSERISFSDISRIVISTVENMTEAASLDTLEERMTADREARRRARALIP